MIYAVPSAKKKKFKKQIYVSKAKWRFPESAEREYLIFMNELMKSYKKLVSDRWPDINRLINQIKSRNDDLEDELEREFDSIKADIVAALSSPSIVAKLRRLSNQVYSTDVTNLKRAFKRTLGIDIEVVDESLDRLIELWIQQNVEYITSIPTDYYKNVSNNIRQGIMNGTPTQEIADNVQHVYGVSDSRAKLIARDQIGKLNGNVSRHLQTSAGIEEYRWRDSRDRRVRDTHAAHNGNIYKWSDPPIDTGNPGEDYQCRCTAEPVFNLDELKVYGFEYA